MGEIDDDDDDAMMMILIEIANATITARTFLRRRAMLLDEDCGASLSSDKLSCWQLCKFLIERSLLCRRAAGISEDLGVIVVILRRTVRDHHHHLFC